MSEGQQLKFQEGSTPKPKGDQRRHRTQDRNSVGHFGSCRVLLKPASPGTGIVAGGVVRAILDSAGVQDVLTKCLSSSNPHNVAKATMHALVHLRKAKDIASARGKTVGELFGMTEARTNGEEA